MIIGEFDQYLQKKTEKMKLRLPSVVKLFKKKIEDLRSTIQNMQFTPFTKDHQTELNALQYVDFQERELLYERKYCHKFTEEFALEHDKKWRDVKYPWHIPKPSADYDIDLDDSDDSDEKHKRKIL